MALQTAAAHAATDDQAADEEGQQDVNDVDLSRSQSFGIASNPVSQRSTRNPLGVSTKRSHKTKWQNASKEVVHNAVQACQGLAITRLLADGKPEDVVEADVLELFEALNADQGYLEVAIILMYLQAVFHCRKDSLEAGVQGCLEDAAEDGSISYKSLHRIISRGNGQKSLQELHKTVQGSDAAGLTVSRELMSTRISWRVDRDEALMTLPLTLVILFVFMCLVIYHMDIHRRKQLESAVEDWIKGYGAGLDGPYLQRHVANARSFCVWLTASGLPAILGDIRNGTDGLSPRLAVSSTLLGDAKLHQRHFDGAENSTWLLHSAAAATQLAANSTAFVAAASDGLATFQNAWRGARHISQMTLTFATYHQTTAMFVLTTVELTVPAYGNVKPIVVSQAVPTDPYANIGVVALDAIFVMLLLFMVLREIREMMFLGCRNLDEYLTVWNFIDWVSIVLGLVLCGLWASCCFAMSADELHRFLQVDASGQRILRPNIMQISESELDEAVSGLERAHKLLFACHIVLAANAVSIIARFFKAFRSNERLDAVAKTFSSCAQDIFHFMIVFLVTYVCMAVIGHVLFGNDVREFHSIGSSCNTCFMVVMGDFGWYVDLQSTPNLLPSGIPRIAVAIWFFAYMFLVSIVLLNMLLAIILEKYTEVGAETLGPHARTIWHQAFRYLDRTRKLRGGVPLPQVRTALQDDTNPAHPSEKVTAETLKDAFPRMTVKQVDFMMGWLKQEAFLLESDGTAGDQMERLRRTERYLARLLENVQELAHTSEQNDAKLKALEYRIIGPRAEELERGIPALQKSTSQFSEDPTEYAMETVVPMEHSQPLEDYSHEVHNDATGFRSRKDL